MTEGLILHLDAETLTQADGAVVDTWLSSTDPSVIAAQAEEGRRPLLIANAINGNNLVRFDGLNDRLALSQNIFAAMGLPRTLFAVVQSDDYRGHIIGTGTTSEGSLTRRGYGLGLSASKPFLKARSSTGGTWLLSPENISKSGPQIIAGSIASAGSQLRTACHVVQNTETPMPPSIATTQIGSTVDGLEAFAGDIAEVLVYNRLLDDMEQTSVLGYLGNRYGAPVSPGVDSDNDGIFDECDTQSIYLNYSNITVELTAGFLTSDSMIGNVINLESATSADPHTRETHVENNRSGLLGLRFDLQGVYEIETIHFWNFIAEDPTLSYTDWDVDDMTFSFYNSANELIGQPIVLVPESGYEDILPEDFDVNISGVRYIEAELRGDNDKVEFMNIGFTAVPEGTQP